MNEVSFDLETLSLDADAQILSIGAVKFDRETKELGDQFHLIIDIGAGHPGKVDGSTVMWWMGQSAEARAAVFGADVERSPLLRVLGLFSEFCEGVTEYWQRGDKDAQWLEASYKRVGLPAPFRFWQLNDQRTLTKAFEHKILHLEHGGAHNALEDALFQARCILAIL